MNRSLRLAFGFLVAPGVPALALYLVSQATLASQEAYVWPVILVICAYLAAAFVGIPMHMVLSRRGTSSLKMYVLAGAFVGLAFYILFFGGWALLDWSPEHTPLLVKNSFRSGVVSIVYAAVSSGLFWLIAIRQQPDS